ncbi:hypothetical protein IE81DRAFT_324887 [Ceraceosorus guamensis]|uniref:Uncharacterized protein n=1 Tax=Ceraceosorus guamensis TaxID=1522189 RepID=A0A316VU84_9BASI|nr:hypothetical protein IE81DRAFT_324887 [Ceraceosorus guamensis]PWN41159.1 hypothetical protein IE81DRAFT_324887 [Ceraceosorus guamensis]
MLHLTKRAATARPYTSINAPALRSQLHTASASVLERMFNAPQRDGTYAFELAPTPTHCCSDGADVASKTLAFRQREGSLTLADRRGLSSVATSHSQAGAEVFVPGASDTASTNSARLPSKILIANRGEIACRIIKTCKALGVRTVAVYSEADAKSLHVQLADEAYCIGPAASSDSYLRADRIINVAKLTEAEMVHPGYGFLSENSDFSLALSEAGITFIGPPTSAIISMGSKSASKAIMLAAGVPCVPGYHGDDQSYERLSQEAKKMGFPVLIKAVKGGGGKGMKIVWHENEFEEQLLSARREAEKSFGDGTVLIEKYLLKPRHVEVQIISSAPPHSQHIALSSRDCSVQRRHQKIIEEAPAPDLSEELRRDLESKAVEAARAVDYVGAGTVEFIMDATTGEFYFMEMNTRLQVEHPVSELVTGVDLVALQLLVASGAPLPLSQEDVHVKGHAFEARLYAEDPASNFLPDVGHLQHLHFPAESSIGSDSVVRIDTGVRSGDDVSVFYDPMIAKLIVHAKDRGTALRRLRLALEQTRIVGPKTNVDFLKRLCDHPAFISADELDTGFIARYKADLLPAVPRPSKSVLTCAALYLALRDSATSAANAGPALSAFQALRLSAAQPASRTYLLRGRASSGSEKQPHVSVRVLQEQGGVFTVQLQEDDGAISSIRCISSSIAGSEGEVLSADLAPTDAADAAFPSPRIQATIVPRPPSSNALDTVERLDLFLEDRQIEIDVVAPAWVAELKGALTESKASVRSPMPCKVVDVRVQVGSKVEAGDVLVVLEAMKTEHVVRAPRAGVVATLAAQAGQMIGEGVELVLFEEETAD